MSAETADNAGTPQLKQFLMVNIDMFRHPKYYKELRRAGVQVNSSRPAHSRCNKSDQAISLRAYDGERERAPGPGLQVTSHKLPGPRPISNANKGLIHRRQASSVKLSNQPFQASSDKHQAPSSKRQA